MDVTISINDNFFTVGKFLIGEKCIRNMKYRIIDTEKDEINIMFAPMIYRLLEKNGLSHPMFDIYKDYYKFERIGKYDINMNCSNTHPCKHLIINQENNEQFTLSSSYIHDLLELDGIFHPHF